MSARLFNGTCAIIPGVQVTWCPGCPESRGFSDYAMGLQCVWEAGMDLREIYGEGRLGDNGFSLGLQGI